MAFNSLLLFSAIYIISVIIVSLMFLNLYITYENVYFFRLFVASFLQITGGTAYIGMILYEGPSYENTVELWFVISVGLNVAISWNFWIVGFLNLIEKPIPRRVYLYVINNILVIPFVFFRIVQVEWIDGRWVVDYQSPVFKLLFILGFFVVITEIIISTSKLVRPSSYKEPKILTFLMAFFIYGALPILILREQLNLPLNTYLASLSLFFLFLGILIYRNPKIFLTSSVIPQFLFVLNKRSGLPIKLYHFVNNKFENANEALLAGALSAVQGMIGESINDVSNFSIIGFRDIILQLETSENIQIILGSDQQSYALKSLNKDISRELTDSTLEEAVSVKLQKKVEFLVKDIFQHQISRLDLYLQETDIQQT